MKLWQVIAAVMILKGADLAFVAAATLPNYQYPPIWIATVWLGASVVIWGILKVIGVLVDAIVTGEWSDDTTSCATSSPARDD